MYILFHKGATVEASHPVCLVCRDGNPHENCERKSLCVGCEITVHPLIVGDSSLFRGEETSTTSRLCKGSMLPAQRKTEVAYEQAMS